MITTDRSVDILLALFNGGRYLNELLASLDSQSHANWRLIARDDGSKDATMSMLEEFKRKHPNRVRIIEDNLGNVGVVKNFELLMKASSAEYIMFADQDDIWFPEKIQLTLEKMRSLESNCPHQPSLVFTDSSVYFDKSQVVKESCWRYSGFYPEFALSFKGAMVQNVASGCTMMINRRVIQSIRPIPSHAIMHDWWLLMYVLAFGRVDFVNTPTLLYRQHQGNDTGAARWSWRYIARVILSRKSSLRHSIQKTQRQAEAFLHQYEKDLPIDKQEVLEVYAGMGRCSWLARRWRALRFRLRKSTLIRTLGFYCLL